MKWMSKRFTFVIIPDANGSVQRYQISGFAIFLVPAAIVLLAVCSALFIYLFSSNRAVIHNLTAQLAASESGYEQQLTLRNERIASLEADLSTLAGQAQEIEARMTEISELELQLKQIAGIEESETAVSSSAQTQDGGQGGQEYPLAQQGGDKLASQTIQEFAGLTALIDEMKPSLEATMEAMLQYRHILDITPTIWPADSRKITSTFGIRRDPLTGRRALHSGLDLGGNRGDPIYATADGVVTLSERTYPQGHNIMINHGRGIETRYMHLNKRLVEVGDKVTKGQVIGELGNTGRSTGPHLHYEVIVNGTHVNPMPYIKEEREERD